MNDFYESAFYKKINIGFYIIIAFGTVFLVIYHPEKYGLLLLNIFLLISGAFIFGWMFGEKQKD